jgi:hypothetical protein
VSSSASWGGHPAQMISTSSAQVFMASSEAR